MDEPEKETAKRNKRRLPKKFVIPSVVILILMCAVLLVVHVLGSPSEGTIIPTKTAPKAATDLHATTGHFDGKYIAFSYPAHYETIPAELSSGYLEVDKFYSTDHTSRQISVGVMRQPLLNDSGINFRRVRASQYKEEKGAGGSLIFTKTDDGAEKTAFIQHGSLELTISFSSPYPANFSDGLSVIMGSLQWKQQ